SYLPDDLVYFQGSSWRAKQASKGKPPATNAADWEIFAIKGTNGAKGADGAPGADGALAGKRMVTKSCSDTGGGGKAAAGYVHCIAACAAAKIPYGASNALVRRSTGGGYTTPANYAFDPAAPAPLPRDSWFSDFYEPARSGAPNTGEEYKQVW